MNLSLVLEVAQWVAISGGILLTLGHMQLVAQLNSHVQELIRGGSLGAGATLKGVNIRLAILPAARGGDLEIASFVSTGPKLLLLVDPACKTCDERLDDVRRLGSAIAIARTLAVVVRGNLALARAIADRMPSGVTVVNEVPELQLQGRRPPFAAVVDVNCNYSGSFALDTSAQLDSALRALETIEQTFPRAAAVAGTAMGSTLE